MNDNGFTLVEVILVISILSIIMTIAIPMVNMDLGYMDKMAAEFIADVRFVQMETMKYPEAGYQIDINKNKGEYYIRKKLILVKKVCFTERYKINYNNKSPFAFTYEGTPINAGTFTILDTKTNESKKVTIVPTTGRTIIKE